MSRIANSEQLARLEAPLVRLVKGALSVALVEVPFGGAPVELDTRALVVLSVAGVEVDVTAAVVVLPRKFDGEGSVRIDIGMSEYVAVITGILLSTLPLPALKPSQINATASTPLKLSHTSSLLYGTGIFAF
jgi:hypothetical protein